MQKVVSQTPNTQLPVCLWGLECKLHPCISICSSNTFYLAFI